MKNELKFQGEVQEILPLQIIEAKSGKTYFKQEVVIQESGEQYPSCGTFEVFAEQGKANKIDGVNVGDTVEVSFNMRTNPFETKPKDGLPSERKMSGTNQIWTLTKIQAVSMVQSAPVVNHAPAVNAAAAGIDNTGGQDDLPF